MNSSKYRIYDPERQAFWRPNRWGYTCIESDAGEYTEEEADEICNQPNVSDYKILIED